MSKSTAEQMRAWRGPAILSFGFRPMFLLAALWAAVAMVLWIFLLTGLVDLPMHFDPVTWHAHEFLFGYVSAVIAGFLLTAVPNWTGRLPVVGWRLAALAVLWVIGRLAILSSAALPVWIVTLCDLSFLTVLWAVILREIIAGKNWRNLPVLALVGVLILSNAFFHFEAARDGGAAHGMALRLGFATVLSLVMLIGGKIIPSFTRNWLKKQGATQLPTPPMQRFDKATIALTLAIFAFWITVPETELTGVGFLIMGALHFMRLSRWQPLATGKEALVWVLHAAYSFIPLGAFVMAIATLAPDILPTAAALHIWSVGAIGLMTLAVMTRASLGHSGRDLHAGTGTTLAYGLLIASALGRLLADLLPDVRMLVLDGAGAFWIVSFLLFAALYGPLLVKARQNSE